jgi:tetratricopeptide (TPR) repeat protein
VLLDDAHLADAAALDAVEHATLAEAGAPIFACALGRPPFAAARPAWGERAAASRDLALGPLPPEVAAELCRRLLRPAEDVPARALDRLVERAHGVPLLLVELVRGLKRDGAIRRHAGGAHYLATDELDRVPDMPVVEWLAERELRGLPADLAAHAGLVALVGDELAPGEVRGVLAGLEQAGQGAAFPLDAEAATRRLLALGVLAEHRGGRVGFRLPLLRDAVARSVPDGLRAAIHEAAWRHYGREGSLPEPVRLRRLAGHAAHAGHAGEAARAHLALARGALARHDFVEADALLTRALEWRHADPAHRLEALRGRGNARVRLGRLEDAVADLAAAREAARGRADREAEVECLLDEATARDWANDFGRSAERLEEASALAAPSDGALLSRLELGRGRSLFRMARWEEAAAALETAAALAERAGEGAYESLVAALLLLGTALPPLGRSPEAEAALERVRELAAARGDLLHLGAAYNNRRNLLVARADLAGAIWDQLESVRIARELGMAGGEFMGEYNIAELYYQAGDLPSAEPHQVRALEIEERHPEAAPVPAARLLGARMAAYAGGPGARAQVEGLEAARARAAALRGALFGPSETVLCDLVDLATRPGPPPADAWAALLRRSASHSVEQEAIEVAELHGLALLRAGLREEGRAALRDALALCDRIPNLLRRRVEAALAAAGG